MKTYDANIFLSSLPPIKSPIIPKKKNDIKHSQPQEQLINRNSQSRLSRVSQNEKDTRVQKPLIINNSLSLTSNIVDNLNSSRSFKLKELSLQPYDPVLVFFTV